MTVSLKSLFLAASCLTLVACGGGSSPAANPGGGGGGTTDTTAPTVSFNPTTLTVVGGSTGASTLTATDNVAVTSTTTTCTNGGAFASNTFTAPDVNVQTTSVCTATASDAAGNSASATLTVTIDPAPDTEAPVLSFSPDTLTVDSNGTATSTLAATDNRGITVGPDVTCNNGGSFDVGTNTYSAPSVVLDDTEICTATASDDAGNTGTATLNVTITGPDTEPPMASFNPMTVTLDSATTATVTLTTSDNVGVTSTDVTCNNGGSWSANIYTAPTTTTDLMDTCEATVKDAADNTAFASFTANVTGVAAPSKVTISGRVTFDLVPLSSTTNGLDYPNTVRSSARGLTVEAVDGAGTILQTAVTDATGRYSVELDPNIDVRIRTKAEMVSTTGAQWNVKVVDNTNGGALYAIQGGLTTSGAANSTRNLYARSGWGGASYTTTRSAGPFAILNPIYDALQKVAVADPAANLPAVNFNWSINNTSTANGNPATGAIGTSYYSGGNIFILGDDDVDTDEYDDHVVVHEWGHYFEDNMSRSDSIGGAHSGGDRLDPRVAFGEGFGNALSGMITDDPFYRDSGGAGQASGFSINVENNTQTNTGWFNEGSVQSILYDIYDSADDGSDSIHVGFGRIYETLISDAYKNTPYFTSIFHFMDQFKANNAGFATGLDSLMTGQTINGTGPDGAGETNSGSIADALPLYKSLATGSAATDLCSVDDAGTYNKLGVRAYLEFMPATTASYTLTMIKNAGIAATLDPDFVIYNAGSITAIAESGTANSESWTGTLVGGTTYIIDAYEYNNVDGTSGDFCYGFTATN